MSQVPSLASVVTVSSPSAEKPTDDTPLTQYEYVLVLNRNIKETPHYQNVMTFLKYLTSRGIQADLGYGNIKENYYIKLHIPDECVQKFAHIYDVDIRNNGHNLVSYPTTHCKLFETPLTNNNDLFKRKSALQPTSAEKIMVLNEMLGEAVFDDDHPETKHGLQKLLKMEAIKDAFPLHDGPYKIDPNSKEPLNDRQLLFKYWANFSVWNKKQPLNLIEKYFGTETAFYFAWLGLYNQMLIIPSAVGTICFIYSILELIFFHVATVDEVCESNLTMCPRCNFYKVCVAEPLAYECFTAVVFRVFDNFTLSGSTIFVTIWTTCFLQIWRRYEYVLKVQWNVTTTPAKTKMRLAYRDRAIHKKVSPVTGLVEPYIPMRVQILNNALSFSICLLLIGVVCIMVFGIIFYRIIFATLIRMSEVRSLKINSPFLEACTSSIIQVFFIKIYGKLYAPMSERLSNLENPRTQFQFDNAVITKRWILGFANNYLGIFYMAFVKGIFYFPNNTNVISLSNDLCHSRGCLVALCIQLIVVMFLKSLIGNILILFEPHKYFKKAKNVPDFVPFYEENYLLQTSGRFLLMTELMEIVIQFGFVTFFVAAFQLAPLCALISNIIELRLDALKLVTRYRRPVPKRQSGFGRFNDILSVVRYLSIAINAFIIGFTSDYVLRQAYKIKYHSLVGFINSTFSGLPQNSTLCHYRGSRYPPDSPHKYELDENFWQVFGLRLVSVVIFEHFILLINGTISYFMSVKPQSVKQTLLRDQKLKDEAKTKRKDNITKRQDNTEKKIN